MKIALLIFSLLALATAVCDQCCGCPDPDSCVLADFGCDDDMFCDGNACPFDATCCAVVEPEDGNSIGTFDCCKSTEMCSDCPPGDSICVSMGYTKRCMPKVTTTSPTSSGATSEPTSSGTTPEPTTARPTPSGSDATICCLGRGQCGNETVDLCPDGTGCCSRDGSQNSGTFTCCNDGPDACELDLTIGDDGENVCNDAPTPAPTKAKSGDDDDDDFLIFAWLSGLFG